MKRNTSSMHLLCAGLALWLGLVSCGLLTTSVGNVKTESQSVNPVSATSAKVQIDFPAGKLKVQNGAGNLMDASFRYNVDDWQPQIVYHEDGTQGDLHVSFPGEHQVPVRGELVNEWEIQLSDQTPLELSINTGAGNSQLDLGGLDMTSLTVETGVGVTTINLIGTWDHDLDVFIQGGVGQLTVNLPSEMGVRVDMDTALVSVTTKGLIQDENGYVNQAAGSAPYTLTLKLEAGVGSVVLAAP
jgi:hypothetical protein